MAAKAKRAVVVETTDNEAVPVEAPATVKRQLRVTATSSDGQKSVRNAPSGIKAAGPIFATEVTRTRNPKWVVNWYHTTKADATAAAKALIGEVRKTGPGDVVNARVIPAEAFFVDLPA